MKLAVFLVTFFVIVWASDATWCVCQSNSTDTELQKAIDFACGHGADCTPILPNGTCFNPNTLKDHCSYAANSYYQRKNAEKATCDFEGTAVITSTDPSTTGCMYPASPSTNGGSSAAPGFQSETQSALWRLSFVFMLIVVFHFNA